jgi:hypothetical protein
MFSASYQALDHLASDLPFISLSELLMPASTSIFLANSQSRSDRRLKYARVFGSTVSVRLNEPDDTTFRSPADGPRKIKRRADRLFSGQGPIGEKALGCFNLVNLARQPLYNFLEYGDLRPPALWRRSQARANAEEFLLYPLRSIP